MKEGEMEGRQGGRREGEEEGREEGPGRGGPGADEGRWLERKRGRLGRGASARAFTLTSSCTPHPGLALEDRGRH